MGCPRSACSAKPWHGLRTLRKEGGQLLIVLPGMSQVKSCLTSEDFDEEGTLFSSSSSNDNQFLWELIGGPPKTRNVSACWQDGRFFAENETWVVDSCTSCTCKKFKTICHQITCPPATCASPSFIEGECCPSCLHEMNVEALGTQGREGLSWRFSVKKLSPDVMQESPEQAPMEPQLSQRTLPDL
ncbi:hypothetical protein P7K49_009086 [Saguinus oedipus]|uniref:VWFC domain-containing protein n=1 Tax=Saguinus oedipus TaxID=9490 RepID=A0ABQ9W058_SAGOE|nr:hypothetical protein P7K49_009086 [Saguinus oedipus]